MLTLKDILPFSLTTDTTGVVAYDEVSRETVAVFIAQNWTPTSVQVHQAILNTMVLRHGWFEEIGNYIFTQAGRLKLYAMVPSNRPKALSLNKKCGFVEKVRLEDACDVGVDFIVMELKREDCPFWKAVNRKAA